MTLTQKEPAKSPATLFLTLWQIAIGFSPSKRANALMPDTKFEAELIEALEQNDALVAFNRLEQLTAFNIGLKCERTGRIFSVMRAIDKIFYRIHPRALKTSSLGMSKFGLPNWLEELKDRRIILGDYGREGEYRLVPRGPLLRSSRDETASNADSLPDRFSALAVVPKTLKHEDRPIKIGHKIVGLSLTHGIGSATNPGEELVAFVPIAEQHTDMAIKERKGQSNTFVDFQLSSSVNGATLLIKALDTVGSVDIVMAPELVISEEHADQFQDLLRKTTTSPRIVITGSGNTTGKDEDEQAWNESRAVNGLGAELWRQRKIWPAGLKQERAKNYALSDPGKGLILEDNAAGDEIVVVDADGLGRCVILICQDIEAPPISSEIIRLFQPDWVFSPILDPGIHEGGWIHQRAFELSSISPARFLVSCSTALARLRPSTTDEPACGLAVGPKPPSDEDVGRVFTLAYVTNKTAPGHAIIQWRHGKWSKTTLGREHPAKP